jgi:hypothetical protein
METILQDLRYAMRTLARQPGFTAIAVFTPAVGIGANTAIYSVVDATLLRTLPFQGPEPAHENLADRARVPRGAGSPEKDIAATSAWHHEEILQ